MKSLLIFAFISAIIMLGFLIGPRIPTSLQKERCAINIKLPGPFGVSLNCDSTEFMHYAAEPSLLLRKNDVRQARPGLILLAAIVSRPLGFLNHLFDLVHPQIKRKLPHQLRSNQFLSVAIPQYAAFTLLNALIILAAFLIYKRLVCTFNELSIAALVLSVLLISNNLVKLYFWSPHTELFNLLIPIYCLWVLFLGMREKIFGKVSSYILTLFAGLGATAYGVFVLYIPAIAIPALLSLYKERFRLPLLKQFCLHGFGLAIVFIFPTLVWYLIVKLSVGNYYIGELSQSHFLVWLGGAVQQNWLYTLYILLKNIVSYLELIFKQSIVLLVTLFYLIMVRFIFIPKTQEVCDNRLRQLIYSALVTSSLFLLFFSFGGMIAGRLAFTMMVPWIPVVGAYAQRVNGLLEPNQMRIFNFVLIFGMIAYSIFEIAINISSFVV